MSLTLFGEPEPFPLQPRFSQHFSPFTKATIHQLYELIDPSPVYNLAWNNEGTDLLLPTSTHGLHHIKFASQLSTNSQPHQPATPSPAAPLNPIVVRLADQAIVKVVSSPVSSKRFVVLTLTQAKVFDVVVQKKGPAYQCVVAISHPLIAAQAGPPPPLTAQAHSTSVLPPNAVKNCFLDVCFKTHNALTILDNANNVFHYNLLSATPTLPLTSAPLSTSLLVPDHALASRQSFYQVPPSLQSVVHNGRPNGTKVFGILPPQPFPTLISQLYPGATAALINAASGASIAAGPVASAENDLVQHTSHNNAAVHDSFKYAPATVLVMNNVLDQHVFLGDSRGEVSLCDAHTLAPFKTKLVSSSPINVLALSTSTDSASPLANRVLRELQQEYSSTLSQINAHLDLSSSSAAARPRSDEKHNQLLALRHNLAALATQIQNEQIVAAGSNDGTIAILSALDLASQYTIQVHDYPITSLSFSPCGTFLASISLNTRSLSELEDGNINAVKGLFCITHVPTGHHVYQRTNHGITAFSWNPVYPVGSVVSLLCAKDPSSRGGRGGGGGFGGHGLGSGDTKPANLHFVSQISIIDFAASFLPPSGPYISPVIAEKAIMSNSIDILVAQAQMLARGGADKSRARRRPVPVSSSTSPAPCNAAIALSDPTLAAIAQHYQTVSSLTFPQAPHWTVRPDPYWATNVTIPAEPTKPPMTLSAAFAAAPAAGAASNSITTTGPINTNTPRQQGLIAAQLHNDVAAVETLKFPSSASLAEPMNKWMSFTVLDAIPWTPAVATHGGGRGKAPLTWVEVTQKVLSDLAARSAASTISSSHLAAVQRAILNQPDPAVATKDGIPTKVDRFAHIKSSLGSFVDGADEVETGTSLPSGSHSTGGGGGGGGRAGLASSGASGASGGGGSSAPFSRLGGSGADAGQTKGGDHQSGRMDRHDRAAMRDGGDGSGAGGHDENRAAKNPLGGFGGGSRNRGGDGGGGGGFKRDRDRNYQDGKFH